MTLSSQLEGLAQAGFGLLPLSQIPTHHAVERDGLVALLEKTAEGGFGKIGTPGLLGDGLFYVLVWRAEKPFLVAKDKERPATTEEVEKMRRFMRDLEEALASPGGSSSDSSRA